MMYTTQVLDAAIQTANALHKNVKPFDFAISLGDTCNSTSYIELRWYIDVIDGKVISSSSGAHLGASAIDYQKPYKAAGLDKSIPWYQALGNHDHFMIGSFPVYADPNLNLSASYISDTVWSVPNELLTPDFATFPALFDKDDLKVPTTTKYYGGVIDGTTPLGAIIHTGDASQTTPPKVVADPNRRSLLRTEWIQEYFKTSTGPVGHGFNLVNGTQKPGDLAEVAAMQSFTDKVVALFEVSNVFDADFNLVGPQPLCTPAHSPAKTAPPPYPVDTPLVSEVSLLWSPVSSKPKLLQLIAGAKQSLVITTEEMTDADMVCQIQAVAQSAAKPSVRILLSGDIGSSNEAAVNTLLGLGLANLSIRVMPGQPPPPVATPTPLYMHGKQVIADGIVAYVGSENLTNTSLIQNRELGMLFTDPVMIARLQSVFTSDFTTPGNSLPATACTGINCATIACPAP